MEKLFDRRCLGFSRRVALLVLVACVAGQQGLQAASPGLETLPPEPISDPPVGGPTVSVTPPHGSRFAPGQRFDIRVEGTGTGPSFGFSATLKIDGEATAFSSGTGDPNLTDGISRPGWGGFNLRGYSNDDPGIHEIEARFTSSQGTKTVRTFFIVEALESEESGQVKNVIILLGDGMGIGVRTAARVALHGVARGTPRGWLEMDQFPTHGMATTHSLNNYLTDSAPGFSSYSTGTHNNNNQEGVFPAQVVSPFFQPRVEYMSEYLHRTQGKVTGIVTTADVEDATPAAMAAHTGDRNAGSGIVDQFLQEADMEDSGAYGSGLRVLMGGGLKWFLPAGTPGSGRTSATDCPTLPTDLVAAWGLPPASAGALDPGRDLISDFLSAGFVYVHDAPSLGSAVAGTRPPSRLLGLFHLANMNVAVDKIAERRGVPIDGAVEVSGSKSPFAVVQDGFPDQPMLDEMADAAIKILSRHPRGFVLLIEGSSIDKQEHAQDGDRTIGDAIEFDRAVGVARRFADKDKQTLVLVLSDHECAGFVPMGGLLHPVTGLNQGSLDYLRGLPPDADLLSPVVQPERQKVIGTNFGGGGFPRYAVLEDGYPENYNVDGKMLMGFGASSDRFERWLTRPLPGGTGVGAWEQAAGMFIRGQSLRIGLAAHGASDVPVSAYAWNSTIHSRFSGTYENIDVFFRVLGAMGGQR